MKSSPFLRAIVAIAPSFCYGAVPSVRNEVYYSDIRTRSAPQEIGKFSLATTIPPGIVLAINVGDKLGGGVSAGGAISASCASCSTTGEGVATIEGVEFNDAIFKNPITAAEDFFKDPLKLIQDSFDAEMSFNISSFTGSFALDVGFSGSGTYDLSIPLPDTPVGGNLPDPPLPAPAPEATVGLVPTIDLVFSVTGAVSFTMGFDFSFPNDASITIDPINGNLTWTNFDDILLHTIPVQFKSGSGTFSASLKLGVKLAFDFHAFGEGFSVESGIFTDLPTYKAAITLDPNATCEVALTEELAVDAGAFASAAVTVDSVNVAIGPKFVTTLATLSLPGECVATTIPSLPVTSALAAVTTAPPVSQIATTGPLTLSSLATPVLGSYVIGTPVISSGSSLGPVPTLS